MVQQVLRECDDLFDRIRAAMTASATEKLDTHSVVQRRQPRLIAEATRYLENFFGSSLKYLGPLRDTPKPLYTVLIEEDSFEWAPAVILDRLSRNCRSALRGDLLIAGIKDWECVTDSLESHLMVASGGVTEHPLPTIITIKAEIHDIGIVLEDRGRMRELPICISQSIPIVFSHEQLIETLDLWSVWDGASSEEGVRCCIDARVKNLISLGAVDDEVCDFVIGKCFVASLKGWSANLRRDYAMVTVESCARVVLGIPKNPVSEFRQSAEGTAKQRIRDDGALAFRTHLTKKGVGLRLMFWKLIDGVIEFANIGGKDELKIL